MIPNSDAAVALVKVTFEYENNILPNSNTFSLIPNNDGTGVKDSKNS
ncbi:hypothetical protein HmCmsJML018_03642 [Escherichia coli]|nr:hypothetical protein HmCmsJML018_03642 [Escherichia coli]